MDPRGKKLALIMFYQSPSSNNFLRLQNLNLPGPSTVRGLANQNSYRVSIKHFLHTSNTNLISKGVKKKPALFVLMKFL